MGYQGGDYRGYQDYPSGGYQSGGYQGGNTGISGRYSGTAYPTGLAEE